MATIPDAVITAIVGAVPTTAAVLVVVGVFKERFARMGADLSKLTERIEELSEQINAGHREAGDDLQEVNHRLSQHEGRLYVVEKVAGISSKLKAQRGE